MDYERGRVISGRCQQKSLMYLFAHRCDEKRRAGTIERNDVADVVYR